MKHDFRADLHCHSTCSDGSLSPIELVRHAKTIGLSALSITDHDTIDAYETAIPAAIEVGLRLGTGIEFSCAHKGTSVHILGYDYSLLNSDMAAFCAKHQERREVRNRKILENLKKRNMLVREEELHKSKQTIGRPHIAKLLVAKGYVSSIKEAFQLYLGEGKCCYDPGEAFSVEESIEIIRGAGGKAFLAHPHLLEGAKLIRELLQISFDGIECHYGRFLPAQEKRWIKIAQEKGWLISGGSDFHGDSKSYLPLGSSWVNEETFNKIFQHAV